MEHFIYALKQQGSELPFYIGKSNNPKKRKKRHLYDAKNLMLNYPVHNKLRKLLRDGLGIDLEILESKLTEDEVDDREVYWISFYRTKTKLCNLANGGEGGKGLTEETIEKIKKANIGQKRSEETRKRISDSRKGIVFSKEHKQNLSKARKKRIVTEETRRKTSETSTGSINIKKYKLTDPNGGIHFTDRGLSDFCRKNNLTPANLSKVLKGERTHHKGWRIEYVEP